MSSCYDLPMVAAVLSMVMHSLCSGACLLQINSAVQTLTAMHIKTPYFKSVWVRVYKSCRFDFLCTLRAGVLADPMCGSGTFLIEAALMATNTAPGLYRTRWPFQSWPDFDRSAWDSTVASARQAQRQWDGVLLGNDVHQGALRLAKR